jgi:galactose mutarotase-like enzyme
LESNGGPDFNEKGALRYGLHGKIANKPAQKVEVSIDGDEGVIRVVGVVDEIRMFGNKLRMTTEIATRVGDSTMTVTDTIANVSAQPGELELLYHINFGSPMLDPGSKIVLPAKRICPRDAVAVENLPQWNVYGPETPGSTEVVFFYELLADSSGQTQTTLRNAAGNQGVSLRFSKNQFPFFTLWKNRQASADGYATGLEPGINFPNPKSFEKQKGRVAVLKPGETRTYQIAITALADAASVSAAETAVAQIQGSTAPEILPQPDPNWAS